MSAKNVLVDPESAKRALETARAAIFSPLGAKSQSEETQLAVRKLRITLQKRIPKSRGRELAPTGHIIAARDKDRIIQDRKAAIYVAISAEIRLLSQGYS